MDTKLIAGVVAAGGALLAAGGVYRMNKKCGYFKKGNHVQYDVSRIPFKKESLLKGKTIVFLGSSVTRGYASHNVSFSEYIAKKDSCRCIKEAVNGTTLIDNGADSYVERMRTRLDKNQKVDVFICQLSTNDATRESPLGEISESYDLESFDVTTVCGAVEYIIAYAKSTWNCPVLFYTNPRYESEAYGKMVDGLLEIQKKWNIGVIDFWNDEKINQISEEERKLYMQDPIHPMKAGYAKWLVPAMEEKMEAYLKRET
ncbi:MAG: SGNH/GDSL hydrolase family protein [Fusicatenibacter sp.]